MDFNTPQEQDFNQELLPFSEAELAAIEEADWNAATARHNYSTANGSLTLLPENASAADIVSTLSKKIPANDYGLPIFFYRSDLLMASNALANGFITDEEATAAIVPIGYQDGYPTMPNGTPWWMQMDHEPYQAHTLFKLYLEQGEEEGIRVLASLAAQQNVSLDLLRHHQEEFYWSSRARAYDLFVVAAETKRREHRIRKTENKHFEAAGKALEPILAKLEGLLNDPEKLDAMDPIDLVEMFEKLHKIQRTSLGLTGQQSSTNKDAPPPASGVEMILRSLTKNVGQSNESQDAIGSRIRALLSDPNSAIMAQELVIRATTGGSGNTGT